MPGPLGQFLGEVSGSGSAGGGLIPLSSMGEGSGSGSAGGGLMLLVSKAKGSGSGSVSEDCCP